MTDTIRKRAERQRRRKAGEVRVEVWLDAQTVADMKHVQSLGNATTKDLIESAIRHLRRAYP